jgi:hypothetical protein
LDLLPLDETECSTQLFSSFYLTLQSPLLFDFLSLVENIPTILVNGEEVSVG